jgi:peptidoglycan/LPS O-acetylase OafA/YrhL
LRTHARALQADPVAVRPTVDRPAGWGSSRDRQRPASVAVPPNSVRPRRYEEFEAYRGIAALLIVIFHAYQFSRQATQQPTYVYEDHEVLHHLFSNLDAGVAWFFALSGFLLFLPIARAAISGGSVQPAHAFLIRRAIRIVPLYYLAITLVWTMRYTGGREQWMDLLRHLTFTQVFDRTHIFWTIGPAWSLAVEVHFYVVLALLGPIIVRAVGRFATERERAVALLVFTAGLWLVGIGYLWWAAFVARIPEANAPAYFGLQARLDNFAAGMLLAVCSAMPGARPVVSAGGATLLRLTGFALIAVLFGLRTVSSVPHERTSVDVFFHSVSAVGFVLIIASTVLGPRESTWTRQVSRPALQFLGLISYSVYLWHEPILIELAKRDWLLRTNPDAFPYNALVLAILSIAAGAVSYRLLERPTMELRHLFTNDGRLARRYEDLPA